MKFEVDIFIVKTVYIDDAKDEKQAEDIAKFRVAKIQYGPSQWTIKATREIL